MGYGVLKDVILKLVVARVASHRILGSPAARRMCPPFHSLSERSLSSSSIDELLVSEIEDL
jgi:hypothetical protein